MSGVPMTPQQFVAKWRGVRQNERAIAQQHFLDLCALFGQPAPATADPTGAFFTFEKGVTKTGGGKGFADVWLRGHFAWEYKGKNKDLDAAYGQLLQYREPLENPPLLVVCDIERYQIHTNFTGTAKRIYEFTNEGVADAANLRLLRALFDAPNSLRPGETIQQVTESAARQFATLADGLRARGAAPERAAHFLTQLLFCLFAEDVGLLPRDAFAGVVRFGTSYPDQFGATITALFTAMRDGGFFNMQRLDRFNGGLFATIEPLDLTPADLALLGGATALDWGSVDTAIIGTLFERSLDPGKRSQLGAHYTGRADILRIVEPVVLAPLRRAWETVRADAEKLRLAAEGAATPQIRRNRQAELRTLLLGFKERLAAVTILDPACGSGNFLTVALGALLDLEKEVVTYGATANLPGMFPEVSPRQLLGLEVNAYAHELAQVAVWIAYLQWMTANGFQPRRDPVLQPLDTIRLQDALLDLSDPAHPKEAAWPEAEFIIGNPPFLGGKRLRTELGDEYVDALFVSYTGRVPREADLVCYFFAHGEAHVASEKSRRVGLIATQAIRTGANRRVLERAKESGDLFMAWSNEPWVLDGAAVRIAIVGFDDGSERHRTLNGKMVQAINPDLTADLNLTDARPLMENRAIAFQGPVKVGAFEIAPELATEMLNQPINPNGRPNSDVVRPWINGMDVTRRSRGFAIIDFGTRDIDDASLYEAPFEYVRQHVKPFRDENRDPQRRNNWWRLGRSGEDLRRATSHLSRSIATPRVAKHRLFVWVPANTLPDSRVYAFARADDYFFGVLHSRTHEVWSLSFAPRHGVGNDPTYNSGTCFETFPFPWPPGKEPGEDDPRVAAIAAAARRLVELRDNWLNAPGLSDADLKKRTLTALYNARPTWLDNAHRALDRAVLDAYGWPHDLADDDLLARLLALNVERASAQDDHIPLA